MSRTKLSIIIDCLFATFCASLVCYAWVQKYLRSIAISLIITFVVATIIASILIKTSFKRNKKLLQSNKEARFANECFEYLSLDKSQSKRFFAKLLCATKTNGNYFFANNKTYYINYEDEELTTKDICKIKSKNYQNVCIFANNLTPSAANACNKFNYVVSSKNEVFLLMKKNNLYPTEPQKTAKSMLISLKTVAKSIFDRKKAKHFLVYGVLLLIISFIVPFTFMYCIFGTISIVFGLVCFMKNPKESISV